MSRGIEAETVAKAEPNSLGVFPPTPIAIDDEKGYATNLAALRRLANSTESCQYRSNKLIQKRSMFITDLFSKLISQDNKKKGKSKKKRPFLMLPPSKEESIRLALAQSKEHASKKQWKPALKALDQLIDRGISSDPLLLQKGLLLGKTRQFKEAKSILQGLTKKKGNKALTIDAQQALKTVNLLQQEVDASNKLFLKQLHDLTNKTKQKPSHIPAPKQFKNGQDLSSPVRKEAALARSQKRYALSLQLLDAGLEHGLESSWLLYEKSLTLKAMGQFDNAAAILKSLAKSKGKDRLIETVQASLQSLDADKDKFAKQRTANLVRHCSSIAADHQWSLRHLPNKPGKGSIKEAKELAVKEARAALQADNAELCLDLIEALLVYYTNNEQAQLIRAQAQSKLGRINQAGETLKQLAGGDGKFARKASKLLRDIWATKALQLCTKKSPQKAIQFFFSQHLNAGINPEYTPQLDDVLAQLNPTEELYSEPELRQHQLNLRFNGQLIELLEARLLQQKPDGGPKPQRKQAPSARLTRS